MAPAPRKALALDTNVLFDLAGELGAAHDFRETFLRVKYALVVPPTVIEELSYATESAETETQRELATKALTEMLGWEITPFNLIPAGHGITDRFAERLLDKGLLPAHEYNDGLILGETALAEIPVLVTSDHHLLDIDETHLGLTFDECDLFHVRPLHPKLLLRAMR